jgi:hypothetical protein
MRQTLHYNIYDQASVRFERERQSGVVSDANLPLGFFEVNEEIDDPDVTVHIGPFKPSNERASVVDHQYHVKPNYLYCTDFEGSAKWEVEIFGFEDGYVRINFNWRSLFAERLIADLLLQDMLITPVVQRLLAHKGCYTLHAAGVSKNDRAYVLAGRGGSFKTQLVLDFMKQGYDFLGEDWVGVTEKGVLPLPLTFVPFLHAMRSQRVVTERASGIRDKIGYLNFLRDNHERWYDDIKIGPSSALRALLLIVKANTNTFGKKSLGLTETTQRLVANNELEMATHPTAMGKRFGHYHRYMLAYGYVFPESHVASYWTDFECGLAQLLADSEATLSEIVVPEIYDASVFNQVCTVLGA